MNENELRALLRRAAPKPPAPATESPLAPLLRQQRCPEHDAPVAERPIPGTRPRLYGYFCVVCGRQV